MAVLNFYTLNTAEQMDLFYSEEDKLNLNAVKEIMLENSAPYSNAEGVITGEGFFSIQTKVIEEKPLIECYCTAQGSLGYFYEAKVIEDQITTTRTQHQYYSKALINITEDNFLIIKFDYSNEESSKSKVKSIVEQLGFEATIFRLDNDLLRKVQERYKWTAAKLDKIEKHGDSTKKVSYEIDPSDDQFQSEVDELYNEHGKMSHIKFEMPYRAPGAPNTVTVKLYSDGHRIVIDESEIPDPELFKGFIIHLLNTLYDLKTSQT
ncbi:hypothetical protein WD019_15475 [Fictibacillus sp. Mic-4]|uniref:hypothetical protein n=1 Tax=Fictibacillus sp. Mic-4 TaxID=3132826 RepID=UPI003CEEE640